MPHLQLALNDKVAQRGRQIKQTHHISDVAARFFDDNRKRGLAMAELVGKPLIGFGFFDRVQVLALDILDQRNFERFTVVKITDNRRNVMNLRLLRRTPASFARNNLITAVKRPHDNRLDHAVTLDALCKLDQPIFGKIAARLGRIGGNISNRDDRYTVGERLCLNIGAGHIARHVLGWRVANCLAE